MARWHPQIHWLVNNVRGWRANDHRRGKNQLRLWRIANINTTIKSWLTDGDGHTNICRVGGTGNGQYA